LKSLYYDARSEKHQNINTYNYFVFRNVPPTFTIIYVSYIKTNQHIYANSCALIIHNYIQTCGNYFI